MKGRRKGFSLIELLLVLVVATGIAGATFYG
ncbi:prepilin-type N-terminal cleavage/methylation domain-containing protein, partial [Klebsiella pneumoniae]